MNPYRTLFFTLVDAAAALTAAEEYVDPENVMKFEVKKNPFICFVGADENGKLRNDLEGMINLLKSAELLRVIKENTWPGQEEPEMVTKELILDCVETLNHKHTRALLGACQAVKF